jgi:hypothetical protein
MRVLILSGVCLGGGVDANPGETHTVIDPLGRNLISRSKARLVEEAASDKEEGEEDPDPLDSMKASELLVYAAAHNLGLDAMKRQDGREKILSAVRAALSEKG